MRYFVVFFKVVMMSLPSVGTVVRLKSQATNLYARGNGIVNFATSEIDGIGVTQDLLKGAIVSTDQALQLVKLLGLIVDETELE